MPSFGAVDDMAPDQKSKGQSPWKPVTVENDFLLGLTEPGFQDLEILDTSDYSLLGEDVRSLIQRADQVAAQSNAGEETEPVAQTKKKKRPKKKKPKSKALPSNDSAQADLTGGETQHVDELLARVSALEAENAQLRQVSPPDDATAAATTPPPQTAAAPELDMSAWDDYGLQDLVIASLAKQKFTAPTDIQHECLPAAIIGNADIVGAAQTGSGKTLAFGLPIINFLVNEAQTRAAEPADDPAAELPAPTGGDVRTSLRALILCPTRELAIQVADHLAAISKPLCIRVAAIVGGISAQKQARLLRYQPPIIVATPGRLWDLMRSGAEHVVNLRHLAFLVLDEADRMVARGHYEELTHILGHIPKRQSYLLRKEADSGAAVGRDGVVQTSGGAAGDSVVTRQSTLAGTLRTYVFSATLTLPDALKARLQRGKGGSKGSGAGATLESLMDTLDFRGKPKVADLTVARKIASKVVEAYVSCTQDERDAMLSYLLLMHPGRTLVFLNTISSVRRVAALLKTLGVNAQVLHAQQQQRQRLKALARFRSDATAVLIATDVAARGLDVPDITTVVQYQLPPTADTYIHRAGRTARAGAEGVCLSLVVPGEAARFAALHAALDRPPPQLFPVDSAVMVDIQARVRLAQRVDELERVDKKDAADSRWRQRNAEAIGVDLEDEGAAHGKGPKMRGMSDAKLVKKLRAELKQMLSQPLRQRMNSKFFTGGTSQIVAQSVAALRREQQDGQSSEADGSAGKQAVLVDAVAMRASIAEAQRVVQQRAGPQGVCGAAAARNKRKHKQLSLAEHQAIALQGALAAKRLKKVRKTETGGVHVPRDPDGQLALTAIKNAASKS